MKKESIGIIVAVIILVLVGGLILLKSQQTPQLSQQSVGTAQPGQILAGKSALYRVFSQEEYEKALKSDKIIFLDFYANWCPICRVEEPELKAGFDSLTTDRVVGFRVHWQDSETTTAMKDLATKFQINSQMTKLILRDGEIVFGPEIGPWDKETFTKQINEVVGS